MRGQRALCVHYTCLIVYIDLSIHICVCSVSDVMTVDPVCVRAQTSIPSAAHLLLHKRIRRLPVTDEEGRLIGIITRSNIIKAAWESRKTKSI